MSKKNKARKAALKQKTSPKKTPWHWRVWRHVKNQWGTYAIILSLALPIVSFAYYKLDKKITSLSGVISSPYLAEVKYLSVGSTRFIIDSPDGVFLRDGEQAILTMNLKDGKLLVSTTIRDPKGKIIAELVNNEWQINKQNIFDRNYTDNALEVRDQSGKVTLQVVHFGDTIHFAGIFRCSNGWTNVFCPLAEGGAVIDIKPPGVEPEHSIQPIFEYSSERHFGSCPGLSSLENMIVHGPGPAYRMGGALDICKGKQQK